jgi:hypothetical protein
VNWTCRKCRKPIRVRSRTESKLTCPKCGEVQPGPAKVYEKLSLLEETAAVRPNGKVVKKAPPAPAERRKAVKLATPAPPVEKKRAAKITVKAPASKPVAAAPPQAPAPAPPPAPPAESEGPRRSALGRLFFEGKL